MEYFSLTQIERTFTFQEVCKQQSILYLHDASNLLYLINPDYQHVLKHIGLLQDIVW